MIGQLFEPGFFTNGAVHTALIVGAVVAVISACVGVFTVIRSQAFAGHSLSDLGTTGGSASFLAGASNPLWGFVIAALAGAGLIELLGARRRSDRDLATGIVLGAALGLSALFLYLDTSHSSTTGVSTTILFGSLFVLDPSMIPAAVALTVVALALLAGSYRMLLLSSLSPELAAARGIRVRLIGALYLVALGLAVALASLTIGALLSTALLIGPPATALRLSKQPAVAILAAALIGVLATWLGILLAYDSYNWPPLGHGWPVSFLIVALIFSFYLLTELPTRLLRTLRPNRQPLANAGPEP
ncbi:MAG TPA: metal ABC transporter permease [Gaiellaceae bacterium]|nr:metal ABC transporter permease [Gaiellaceae bacterium]